MCDCASLTAVHFLAQVRHCADFFTLQALAAIACLPHLKVLRLEELRCRIDQCSLAELSNLTQVAAHCCTDILPECLYGIESMGQSFLEPCSLGA